MVRRAIHAMVFIVAVLRIYSVCGGGMRRILSSCSKSGGEDEKLGVEIIYRSLAAPIKQIAANAGLDGAVVAHNCRSNQFLYSSFYNFVLIAII